MREVLTERFAPKKSSLVEYIIYDAKNKELEVKYKSGKHKGKLKKYAQIAQEQFEYIVASESVGRTLISILEKRADDDNGSSFWKKIQSLFTGY
jgi:hypothetical protein